MNSAALQKSRLRRWLEGHPDYVGKGLVIVGGLIAACFIAAVVVSIDERQTEAAQAQGERDRAQWHDEQHKLLDDPKVR